MDYCAERGIPHSEFLEWDDVDRAKALAWMYESASRCSSCGTAPWEWEDDRFAYEPIENTCRGCELKDLVRDDPERVQHPGVYITLRKRE